MMLKVKKLQKESKIKLDKTKALYTILEQQKPAA